MAVTAQITSFQEEVVLQIWGSCQVHDLTCEEGTCLSWIRSFLDYSHCLLKLLLQRLLLQVVFYVLLTFSFLPRSSLSSPFRVCREVTGLQEILASFFMNLQNSENEGKQLFLVSLLTGELVPQVIGLTLHQLSTRLRFDSI